MQPRHSRAAMATPSQWQESYACGFADGRRTAEAEFDAERCAVAVLANSMALVSERLLFRLNPGDLAIVGPDHFDVHVVADAMIAPGAVRAEGRL